MANRQQLRASANERARIALAIMQREGLGIEAAAARVKTTRRNVRRFMKDMGISTRRSRRRGDRGKLLVTRQPLQKVRDFIDDMNQGMSATAAAKKSHTTVRTMSKILVKGEPLLVKTNNRWELNVLIKHIYSLVYYGYLTGLGGKVQGGGEDHPDEHQYGEEDEDGIIESPDAPSVWWQIDFDYFVSTLPEERVGQFWKPAIMQWLREELETPNLVEIGISTNFLGNAEYGYRTSMLRGIFPQTLLRPVGLLADLKASEDRSLQRASRFTKKVAAARAACIFRKMHAARATVISFGA